MGDSPNINHETHIFYIYIYISPKMYSSIDTKNDGLDNGSPFKHSYFQPDQLEKPSKKGATLSLHSFQQVQLFLSFPDSSVAPYMYLKRSKNGTL